MGIELTAVAQLAEAWNRGWLMPTLAAGEPVRGMLRRAADGQVEPGAALAFVARHWRRHLIAFGAGAPADFREGFERLMAVADAALDTAKGRIPRPRGLA